MCPDGGAQVLCVFLCSVLNLLGTQVGTLRQRDGAHLHVSQLPHGVHKLLVGLRHNALRLRHLALNNNL